MKNKNDITSSKANSNTFPSGRDILDYSLRELQQIPNAKIISQGNRITIQCRCDEGIVRADVQKYSHGETRMVSVTPTKHSNNQQEFENTIMQRLSEGYSQSDVALTMGISQSRVSQIKKKHSK